MSLINDIKGADNPRNWESNAGGCLQRVFFPLQHQLVDAAAAAAGVRGHAGEASQTEPRTKVRGAGVGERWGWLRFAEVRAACGSVSSSGRRLCRCCASLLERLSLCGVRVPCKRRTGGAEEKSMTNVLSAADPHWSRQCRPYTQVSSASVEKERRLCFSPLGMFITGGKPRTPAEIKNSVLLPRRWRPTYVTPR